MLIQFDRTYVQDFRNQMIKAMPIMKNYGGQCLGIGEELIPDEGTWQRNKAMAVFEFSDAKQAQMWIDSDPGLHQPDFMHGADILLVPAKRRGMSNCWMQVMDVQLAKEHLEYFDKKYAMEHLRTLEQAGGSQLIASAHSLKVRGLWDADTGVLVCNQFPRAQDYRDWYCGDAYQQVKGVRADLGLCRVVSFQLTPLCHTCCKKKK